MISTIRRASSWPLSVQLVFTAIGIMLGVLVQMPLETKSVGDPFTVFISIVFVAALLFGRVSGVAAVILSSIVSTLFFDPIGTLKVAQFFDLVQIQIYTLLAIGAVFLADEIHGVVLSEATKNDILASETRFKSLQLKEAAHRVANNFSSLDALLRQRAYATADPKISLGFEQASELVQSIARLNRRLDTMGEEGIIETKEYLTYVCEDLEACAPPHIRITCDAENFALQLQNTMLLGLIINEAVTNSFKYAFPGGRTGSIHVTFGRVGHNLQLLIEDNGVGMDGTIKGGGQGFPLLKAFSDHLRWKVLVHSTAQGTSTSVSIPYQFPAPAHASEARATLN